MQLIRFTTGYPPYNAGETAGFPASRASVLIKRGVAMKVETQEKEHKPQEIKQVKQPPRNKMQKPRKNKGK